MERQYHISMLLKDKDVKILWEPLGDGIQTPINIIFVVINGEGKAKSIHTSFCSVLCGIYVSLMQRGDILSVCLTFGNRVSSIFRISGFCKLTTNVHHIESRYRVYATISLVYGIGQKLYDNTCMSCPLTILRRWLERMFLQAQLKVSSILSGQRSYGF